jgi:hypothetical protein
MDTIPGPFSPVSRNIQFKTGKKDICKGIPLSVTILPANARVRAVSREKDSLPHHQFSCMTPHKCCPLKFGTVVNDEGMIVEIACSGKDCAWFFGDSCSIRIIAQQLSNSQNKYQKKMAAD